MSDTIVNRQERQRCWDARDEYFECLDANKITNVSGQDSSMCAKYYDGMSKLCRQTWIDYFIARREREFQIAEMKRRAEMSSEENARARRR